MANGPSQPALAVPRVTWLERGLFALLCGLYLFLCAFYARNIGSEIVDDAFIIFRYADNFARGEGLVYNPGEPVEGYTSFSWTLLLGLLATPGQSLVGLAQTLGVLSGLLSLSLAWWLGRALLSEKRWLPLLVVALLATNRSVSVWAIEGLETKFFGLSLLATLVAWVRLGAGGSWRGVPVVGLLAAWMALTRPEGLLFQQEALRTS